MSEHPKPGRPRSPQADEAILAAAREMLAEGGLHNLTVEGTALRAGVAKTTIYRRYPSRLDLAVAAVGALVSQSAAAGDTIEDKTTSGLSLFQKNMGTPGAQAAYLAVAAAAAQDQKVHERFAETVLKPAERKLLIDLRAAIEEGVAAADVDIDFLHDVLVGTLLHRSVIRQDDLDESFQEQFTALVKFLYRTPE